MKFLIPVTFAVLVAAIAYLIVDGITKQPPESPTVAHPASPAQASPLTKRNPHLVRTLIDPTKHLDEQIEAIRALPADLTAGEFQALIDLLYDDVPATIDAATWSTLQNEIMEVLRHRRFDIKEYPTAIAGILSDKEASPIMRDYAAQHLTLYLSDRAQKLSVETINQSLSSLIAVLEGNREAGQQVTGTTLMALCDLNQRQPQLLQAHRESLNQSVLHLLDLEQPVTLSNRVSAIQAAGRLQLKEALPQIREMAQDPDLKPTFRLSSIAALGYYAQPQDQPLLEEIAQGASRFRFAAQTALKNF